jgi:hypothetical protein
MLHIPNLAIGCRNPAIIFSFAKNISACLISSSSSAVNGDFLASCIAF